MSTRTWVGCRCGKVTLQLTGAAIVAVECHCTSCRNAGGRLERPDGAPRVLEPNGGTHYVLYRKDRAAFVSGRDLLRAMRLTPSSKTRRVVAACCNTPLFTEFESGHWLSLYAGLWPDGTAPHASLRTMVSDHANPATLDAALPNHSTQPPGFFVRLLAAWVAMGFRVPRLEIPESSFPDERRTGSP